jgi:hypothetical protein
VQRCAPRFETLQGIRKKRTGHSQLAAPERLTPFCTELGESTVGLIVAVAVDEQPWAPLARRCGAGTGQLSGPGPTAALAVLASYG